jgi:branched-chain amino acid transport system permease protein
MDWGLFSAQFLNGLQLGVLLFLVAAGLTLVFGIMDFINLAHGSFIMIGAFICATLTEATGSFVVALLLAVPATFVVGLITERIVVRNLYLRDHLDHVLATYGLILIFNTATQLIWGPEGMVIPIPHWLDQPIDLIGGMQFPSYRIVIIAVGLALALGLYGVVNHTRLGMLIRAGASNREMVDAMGVDINKLFTIVFALGAAMAGLAGMLIAPISEASIGMGDQMIITAFVVIVIGGIGSIKAAFLGAMTVGMIDTLGRSYIDGILKLVMTGQNAETAAPALSSMLIYILMAVVLALRPQGLFPPKLS